MKKFMRLALCALLIMAMPIAHAQGNDADWKLYAKKAGDMAVKATDIAGNYQLWTLGFLAAHYLGCSYDLPRAVDLFAKVSLVRSVAGLVTSDAKRMQDAQQGAIMASLMNIALQHCSAA